MNLTLKKSVLSGLPLLIALAGCAPSHDIGAPAKQQVPASNVSMELPAAVQHGWPQSNWWQDYHDAQLNSLMSRALANAPDMQIADQRIKLAEAQARMSQADLGPELDFGADVERQKMSAEGLMGPFATDSDGNTGPWYTNGTFGLTAGWDLDLWGKNRALVQARIGEVKAQLAERAQTRELLSSSVARLYWQWQTEAAIQDVLQQIKSEQNNIVTVDTALLEHGITNSAEGAENDINVSKTDEQLADVAGNMKEIEARLMALTNSQSRSLNLRKVALPAVASKMPTTLGYELLARRPDLQEAHWYIEASLSEVDAAKAAFYPDINLMAFLQQDALHLSDLFRHSAQQMGVTAGLTLPIFDSGRLNANLDIASAQNNLSVAKYNKAVVDAVNQVAKTASQVETLMAKNQQQAQVEKDVQRVVNLAQQRKNAGIISGAKVSVAKLPALQERMSAIRLHGQWIDASIQLTSALGGGYHITDK
ncbi:TPA: multidrug resistance outer membrane protein MdtQ [Kluyvera cryocrescens]|uniref:Multidrug resistance outer membrane protein MdtP n=1 Tax=Kluyvera cryocrescens TaxID=580 RepID=A0A485BUE0_KLUCR|nr:multidrug resistance outer membrane protein MdtQ [Kluyvera cryocrescens]MCX2869324.1 multidrug resistance outer membrane protein MdtQ [Kluyvera cryocrescens]MDU5688306.1 multidrug resistance outer membrane protein MdtQ [Kluyvera cryocrescens]MDW3779846.1 multidrug resistance outer membrane protein MdtQ [Kluyvera cryocrescens]MEB6633256.1 multidrug resistance outer membrane protein MdtQ [Kluyvera cryocrescens]MEB7558285.1 multidrug resistance outer membrane protein MdtQ [Kluyvera cryocrescen